MAYEGAIFEKKFAEAHPGTIGQPRRARPWAPGRGRSTASTRRAGRGAVGQPALVGRARSTSSTSASSTSPPRRAWRWPCARVRSTSPFPQDRRRRSKAAAGNGREHHQRPSQRDGSTGRHEREASPPWNDIHVRRAVAYALNRQATSSRRTATSLTQRPHHASSRPANCEVLATKAQVDTLLQIAAAVPVQPRRRRRPELAQSAYPHGFSASEDRGGDCATDVEVSRRRSPPSREDRHHLKNLAVSSAQWSKDFATEQPGAIMYAALRGQPRPEHLPSYMVGTAATYNCRLHAALGRHPVGSGLATSGPARRLSNYGQLLKHVETDVPYVGSSRGTTSRSCPRSTPCPRSRITPPSPRGRSTSTEDVMTGRAWAWFIGRRLVTWPCSSS